MRTRQSLFHLLALAACFFLLARPDRLWSSVPPSFADEWVAQTLIPLTSPVSPSLDQRFGPDLDERIYALRGYRRLTGTVAAGQNLNALLSDAGIAAADGLAFARQFGQVFDLRTLRPGDTYDLLVGPRGRPERFTYRRSPVEIYQARAVGDGWTAERVQVPVERREKALAGTVSGSLYTSFLDAGGDADLVMAFADLFAWDLDFSRDARDGDRFRVVYETLFAGDEPVGNGRILVAEYLGKAGRHTAVYFDSGATQGYFDVAGKSVRKSFLRSPLRFTRISSRFSRARRHPVLKVVRPHSGVDYAAPAGTPVWSVADGTVLYAGWKGQAGKTVVIRHSKGYETSYNHLSGYPGGIRKGVRVSQGQTVGYVGSTGLATGPHLDYRVKKDGRWVDPLREKFVAGDPVPDAQRDEYARHAAAWMERLETTGSVEVAREGGP